MDAPIAVEVGLGGEVRVGEGERRVGGGVAAVAGTGARARSTGDVGEGAGCGGGGADGLVVVHCVDIIVVSCGGCGGGLWWGATEGECAIASSSRWRRRRC